MRFKGGHGRLRNSGVGDSRRLGICNSWACVWWGRNHWACVAVAHQGKYGDQAEADDRHETHDVRLQALRFETGRGLH